MNPKSFAFVAALFICAGEPSVVPAQEATPSANPVVAHYRAYRAAFTANDLATAETEADAALHASVARDGDGGRTAVLAVNLAKVRLVRGNADAAYSPALQAFTIVSTHGGSGVDPLVARLVLGRAELTEARQREGRSRLEATLREVATRADLRGEAYDAAADLARWLYGQQVYDGAANAWNSATEFANAVEIDQGIQTAQAQIGYGASRIQDATRLQYQERNRPTDTRIVVNADREYRAADQALWDAQSILGPLAYSSAEPGGLTVAQRAFANAVAWRGYLRSFLTTTTQASLPLDYAPANDASASTGGSVPRCQMHVVAEPLPAFPPGASSYFVVGAVVVRLLVDERGNIIDRRIAAAVPGLWFQPAVERVLPQWRVEREADSPTPCRVPRIMFFPIRFLFS